MNLRTEVFDTPSGAGIRVSATSGMLGAILVLTAGDATSFAGALAEAAVLAESKDAERAARVAVLEESVSLNGAALSAPDEPPAPKLHLVGSEEKGH